MAKKLVKLIFVLFLILVLLSIPVIVTRILSESYEFPTFGLSIYLVAIIVVVLGILSSKKDGEQPFIKKQEPKRFKRESEECDKYAK